VTPAPIGVLVMAYGTASGPGDIERYYTDIRGGRPPSPEHLQELRDRYAAIGNVFPLLDTTRAQAEGLVSRLNADHGAARGLPEPGAEAFRAYLGMKHSEPIIAEGVARMRADGIRRGVGIVMAPHWSGMSVETYVERVTQAAEDDGGGPAFSFVRTYHDHPAFIAFLADRVREALGRLGTEEREKALVIFSAHSLPVRTLPDGSLRCKTCDCDASCRYRDGLQRTADLVAARLGLAHHAIGWQSAGRTADPWWGPSVEDVIREAAAEGHPATVVCSAGFVADHLEVLYDLDIEAREVAEASGLRFERTRMPNADPVFLDVLAAVVREHLAGEDHGSSDG
jgi:ferrochelatase